MDDRPGLISPELAASIRQLQAMAMDRQLREVVADLQRDLHRALTRAEVRSLRRAIRGW
jgi:division protein CdvB (Snf7/Vps24/ESCRT-III family)